MQEHRATWTAYFRAVGYPGVQPLGAGMEGAVYRLRDGLIAKVWASRSTDDLVRLQQFYRDLASAGIGIATPEIGEIRRVGDAAVSFERELPGRPLSEYLTQADPVAPSAAQDALISVLRAFAALPATPSARALGVLGGRQPLWHGTQGWADALADLIVKRVSSFGDQLRRQVTHFDAKLERLLRLVHALEVPLSVLHGDLVPANVLVDPSLRTVAVVDFGFLSTAGDPAMDAALAASCFNMYGPHAQAIDDQLTTTFVDALGHPRERLTLYKAAYAAITSNCYDPSGKDGHFRWCVQMLDREDVAALLLG